MSTLSPDTTHTTSPGVSDSQPPLQVEVESGDGVSTTALAAILTTWQRSVVTAASVERLGLKRLPMPPSLRQRFYETPAGLLQLKDYVSMVVQGPRLGIPRMEISVAVLDYDGCHDLDAGLWLGTNFQNKVKEGESRQALVVAVGEPVEIAPAPPQNGQATPELRVSSIAIRIPEAGGAADQVGPRSPNTDQDPALLAPYRPDHDVRSRTTSRQVASLFTGGDFSISMSTPASTWGLDGESAPSRDAGSGCEKSQPATSQGETGGPSSSE